MASTLVTEVILHTSAASKITIRDVPTRVERHGFTTELQFNGPMNAVTVRMNGAERIALIELLGGTANSHD